jgi:hypothetical protein
MGGFIANRAFVKLYLVVTQALDLFQVLQLLGGDLHLTGVGYL